MSRVKSFDAPHKGLRNILSKFSFLLGQTSLSNVTEATKLKLLGHEMFTLLNDHVYTENEYILKPLEEKMKGASSHDFHEHEELEKVQSELEKRVELLNGDQSEDERHQLYLDFSQFHSLYLEHIYHEETVTEKLLWANYTDEELIEHRKATMQRITFPVLLVWLKYIIPAQTEIENIRMLSGFKANAPTEAFQTVLATIEGEMSGAKFNSLRNKL